MWKSLKSNTLVFLLYQWAQFSNTFEDNFMSFRIFDILTKAKLFSHERESATNE